jgi:hypothetical protein
MTSQFFIEWFRERVPPSRWEQVGFLMPLAIMFLLPVGSGMLQHLGRLGWYGAARATQGLMLLSVLGGPVVGLVILWCVDESGLSPLSISRTKWLARLPVVMPLLTLLVMFTIGQHLV